MKKIITTVFTLVGITLASFAQLRDVEIAYQITSPTQGDALPCGATDSFDFSILAINMGPDTIKVADTLIFFTPSSESGYIWWMDVTTEVAPGDTIINGIFERMNIANIENFVDSDNNIVYTAQTPIPNGNIRLALGMNVRNRDGVNGISSDPAISVDQVVQVSYNCNTSINTLAKTAINVYPNPAKNNISINFEANAAEGTIRIFDVMGRTIMTQTVAQNTTAYSLDISSLNTGTYFAEYTTDAVRGTAKFMVSK